ncbi:MAG: WD40/YVTN/BNR-like repeat-containing protein [Anaerolineae bacterium]
MIHPDVHSVNVHPSSPNAVIAPTGGGLYVSSDGGARWQRLYRCYCRAVWVDPGRADHMVFGPADSVDENGRIEETHNAGETWERADEGLDTAWPRHMVERFLEVDGELLAVLSNGELIAAPLDTLKWRSVIPAVQQVNAVAALEM